MLGNFLVAAQLVAFQGSAPCGYLVTSAHEIFAMYQLILAKSLLGLGYFHILFVLCVGARMAHRLWALKPGLDSRQGEVSRPVVGLTKPPIKCVQERLSPRKRSLYLQSHTSSTQMVRTQNKMSACSQLSGQVIVHIYESAMKSQVHFQNLTNQFLSPYLHKLTIAQGNAADHQRTAS
jgi:hypothetical protein